MFRAGRVLLLCCSVLVQTDGGTPLSIASDAGHVEVVRVLLGGGAAVNQGKVCCRVRYAVTSRWVHAVEENFRVEMGVVCMFGNEFGCVSGLL